MSIRSVHIRGDGLAAWCCARLLHTSGIAVSVERPPARKRPWILVSDPVQRLLCEIAGDPHLFRDLPRIRKRTVTWGRDAETATLDHSAAVVAEQDFLDRLWPTIPQSTAQPDWTILASGQPQPETAGSYARNDFGTRQAILAEVELRTARQACWIESFDRGWLFLIAGATDTGSLIAVGAGPEELLASSRSIRPHISAIRQVQPEVPAYPRIASPMFGDGWLACGAAAMMLDPICGDGSGHAVREAILATAVLRGGATPALLDHYQARLRVAFERHLSLCRGYYVSGRSGSWWEREIGLLDQGLAWTHTHATSKWQYRLLDLDLVPIGSWIDQQRAP